MFSTDYIFLRPGDSSAAFFRKHFKNVGWFLLALPVAGEDHTNGKISVFHNTAAEFHLSWVEPGLAVWYQMFLPRPKTQQWIFWICFFSNYLSAYLFRTLPRSCFSALCSCSCLLESQVFR